MELRYPIIFIGLITSIISYFIISKKKPVKHTIGSKIANTKYLKNNEYYKKKIKEYNLIKKFMYLIFGSGITASIILMSRLTKVETINNEQYNRDIYLCMDASASVDELNVELVESLKNVVNKLHGERFGISIFNTSSVVLVPLTDDYDYVINVLNELKKSIDANNSIDYDTTDYDDDYFYIKNYVYSGTIEGSETRGSSLIGDGLASCVYKFPNNDERTKIIIFSTDNVLAGTPLVTLDKAAQISKNKNVKVFGIGTKIMKNEDRINFKNAVELTEGKFYEHSNSTVNSIIKDIEATSKSLLKNQKETKKADIPQIPFLILVISITGLIIISKKVNI